MTAWDQDEQTAYKELSKVAEKKHVTYHVKAEWDPEAEVWVASSDDVPGLATGADTFELLVEKLKLVIPELLEENGLLPTGSGDIPFAVTAERIEHAKRVALWPTTKRRASSLY